uniref:Uncharacterized protein n=1 Tax=Oryza meridionalis TaxID=40149 RepID=A0A0E0CW46_9ORYZ
MGAAVAQPVAASNHGGGWWGQSSLQVVAESSGGRAKAVKAAKGADFFQPSDTRPIMLVDDALHLKQFLFMVVACVCNLYNGGVRFVQEHDPNIESGMKLVGRSVRAPDIATRTKGARA